MARSIVSLGMLAARASSIARRRRGLESGSPPPIRAATVMALEHFVQTLPRLLSSKAFLCLMLDEWEWPAMWMLRKQAADARLQDTALCHKPEARSLRP